MFYSTVPHCACNAQLTAAATPRLLYPLRCQRHSRGWSLCGLSNVVPSPPSQVLDGLGDLLMPAVTPQSTGGSTTGSMAGSMGTPITPGVAAVPPATPPPTKTIGGVLDSALDNLIGGKW